MVLVILPRGGMVGMTYSKLETKVFTVVYVLALVVLVLDIMVWRAF